MKKYMALFLIVVFGFVIISPQPAYASAKINKTKATLEVDASLQLKIAGSNSKVSWKSSKPSIANVDTKGNVSAKSEGIASITGTVGSKKFVCKITVVNNNDKNAENPDDINTFFEFENYLNEHYSSLNTAMGKMKFTHMVVANSTWTTARDYLIWTEWEGIDPYDIMFSDIYTDKEKDSVKIQLKDMMESIYNDAITFFPYMKVEGGYCNYWYDDPETKTGYNQISFLSWQNFNDTDEYYKYDYTKIGKFHWTTQYDNYDFTY